MSASASKKKRKELDSQGLLPSQLAAREEKEKKTKTLRTVLIAAAAVVVALGLIIGVGMALKADSYKPKYDVTTPAAEAAGYQISVPMYNYFYNELATTYANYGLITANTALGDQTSMFDSSQTWEDYLKAATLDNIKSVYAVYDAAARAGYTLTEDDKTAISDAMDSMREAAKTRGYTNVSYFLSDVMGSGCNVTNYEEYVMLRQFATGYSSAKQEELTPDDAAVTAELEENSNEYVTVYYKLSTVTAENSAEEGEDAVYTDEAKAAAKAEAEETAKSFPEDLTQRSGAYSSISSGTSAETAEWLFDAARKEGDVKVFESADGVTYTVVRFDKLDKNDYNRVVGTVLRLAFDTAEGVTDNADAFAAISAGLKNGMDEADFNALLSDNNQSASETAVDHNSYTEAVISWLYDSSRQEGDVTTITDEENSYYYVLRYCETQEETYDRYQAKTALTNEAVNEWYEGVTANTTGKLLPGVGYANTNLTFYSNSAQ